MAKTVFPLLGTALPLPVYTGAKQDPFGSGQYMQGSLHFFGG